MNITFLKLYITNELNSGFYNSQEIGLAKAIVDQNPEHKVDIVLLTRGASSANDVSDRITVHAIQAKGVGHHGVIDLAILKELKADFVHLLADNMYYAPQVIEYCRKNGIRCHLYIGTLYSDSQNKVKSLISKVMIGRNIAAYKKVPVYAKTPYVQKQLSDFGISAKVVPVGLSAESTDLSAGSVDVIRDRYGLPLNDKIMLFVGRLEEYKHPLEAVELLGNVNEAYHLLIVGDGHMKSVLLQKVRELGLEKQVTHFAKIPNAEMKDLYKACDFYVNFNPDEIYGMAILEAMCHKCPVLAMSAPGPEFLLDDYQTGFVCDSVSEMAEKVTLLAKNQELVDKIACAAREKVLEELTWDKTVKLFDDID